MTIRTRLTESLGIQHPVLSAPMAGVAGHALAAAVSEAGGMGFLGAGYCDPDWVRGELEALHTRLDGNHPFGIGAITWALNEHPGLRDRILEMKPRAFFLSFGDIRPHVDAIHRAGTTVVAQVQTLSGARDAADAGADIIVAQGTEAGGHGGARATLPLVTAVVDAVPDRPVLASGGIADGRGLAAALMLGADGVVCGTAFCTADEALTQAKAKAIIAAASGDDTIRSGVFDVARNKDWPPAWNLRTLKNAFTERWHDDIDALKRQADTVRSQYQAAFDAGDFNQAAVIVGEAVDLVRTAHPAGQIVQEMVAGAAARLAGAQRLLG